MNKANFGHDLQGTKLSKEALHKLCEQSYKIISFVDIAEISYDPGRIYQILDSNYRPQYQENERLIFYSSFDISEELLGHLYQATNLVDISNCFVIICTPFDLATRVSNACQKFSQDPLVFQTLVVDLVDTSIIGTSFAVPDTLCPEPWTNLEVTNNGTIKPCCVNSQVLGNVTRQSLKDAFHSDEMSLLRKQLLAGTKAEGCKVCWNVESIGGVSNRIRQLLLKKKDLLAQHIQDPTIKSLDLKAGITCNFKCRICGPEQSSSHLQEQAKHQKKSLRVWPDWIDTEGDQVLSFIDTLTNLDMYGGEPFLVKKLTFLVEKLVSSGRAPDIRLHYNSNGSIYPDFLIDHWRQFKHVDIHFSIDNVGPRFELERGGSWEQTHSNIKRLIDLQLPNVEISIMPTVSIMNVLYLDEVCAWAKNLKLDVNLNFLTYPSSVSISMLTNHAKNAILEKFKNNDDPQIKVIMQAVKNIQGSNGRAFVQFIKKYDDMRQEDFSSTHAQIAQTMGYVSETSRS